MTLDPFLVLIAAVFALAGFIKGVIGLGLPTVSMGLLAVAMPPGQALAIVIVPAIVTNIWQTFVGPYLRDIVRRLWPLMLGTIVGIWLDAGHAGDRHGEGRTGAGTGCVLHRGDGRARLQYHRVRSLHRRDRIARRNRDGRVLRRHFHRPGGARAHAGRQLPPLVSGRNDS